MSSNDRYQPIRDALPAMLPPITREEASRAATRLMRKFGTPGCRKILVKARRVWISREPTRGDRPGRGWSRLIHDVSHRVFRRWYPGKRPHDPLHVHYEEEIAAFVASSGWLDGTLAPRFKERPSPTETHAAERERVDAAIKRWESKLRRAQNALKKLARKKRRLESSAPRTEGTQS